MLWFHVNFQNTNINERKNNSAIGLSLPQAIELSLEMHLRFNLKSRLILLFAIWIYEKHCKRSAKQQMCFFLCIGYARSRNCIYCSFFYWKNCLSTCWNKKSSQFELEQYDALLHWILSIPTSIWEILRILMVYICDFHKSFVFFLHIVLFERKSFFYAAAKWLSDILLVMPLTAWAVLMCQYQINVIDFTLAKASKWFLVFVNWKTHSIVIVCSIHQNSLEL